MIDPSLFFESLENIVDFYTGVPDSLLKDFCAYLSDHTEKNRHIIAANEGNSIALAAGHYLATGKPSLVYMQNSGLGNAVNPLISLMDQDVYKIPVLLLVGWRGEPGIHDEPQHIKQGKITLPLLECMQVDYVVMDEKSDWESILDTAREYLGRGLPFAIVVRKNTFSNYSLSSKIPDLSDFSREEALKTIIQQSEDTDLFVSTTGKVSRELFELREEEKQPHFRDFLIVGSMGHTSQIAAGVALAKEKRKVFCLDGDGSVLMHMGSLAINGNLPLENMVHIVFNNGAHDTVGGQPTVAGSIDLCSIARSSGYDYCASCSTEEELVRILKEVRNPNKLSFIEVLVKKGARNDLGRPTVSPIDCKNAFSAEIKTGR